MFGSLITLAGRGIGNIAILYGSAYLTRFIPGARQTIQTAPGNNIIPLVAATAAGQLVSHPISTVNSLGSVVSSTVGTLRGDISGWGNTLATATGRLIDLQAQISDIVTEEQATQMTEALTLTIRRNGDQVLNQLELVSNTATRIVNRQNSLLGLTMIAVTFGGYMTFRCCKGLPPIPPVAPVTIAEVQKLLSDHKEAIDLARRNFYVQLAANAGFLVILIVVVGGIMYLIFNSGNNNNTNQKQLKRV